ncbi:MAG: hypothetical protein HKN39_00730 [Flavobacteriales bacterium]|nr:hypothetical protein [Flavobacteriales bacterium]
MKQCLNIFGVILLSLVCSFALSQEIDPNGYNKFYYENGVISSEGNMKDGKPVGYWKTYHENGLLKSEGGRKDLLLDSIWNFYNTEGKLTDKINYLKGKKNGIHEIYREGKKISAENFANNVRSGESSYFYLTGELHKVIPFENGAEEGTGVEYAKDGRMIALLTYKQGFLRKSVKLNRKDKLGRKQGLWQEYHANGKLKMEGNFIDDLRNGLFKYYDEKGNLTGIEKYDQDKVDEEAEESVVLDIKNEYSKDGKVISSGGYKDGKKHGTHRNYDEDGRIVSGTLFDFGTKKAEGLVDKNGTYQGEWKLFYPTGELRAEGDYKDGKKVKDWKYYHKDGTLEQKGKYTKGRPSGEWKWYYKNGILHREEYYRKGREDGLSIEYNEEGEIITKGEYIDGLKEGEWFYHVGDHTEKGSYSDGEKNSNWIHTYDNGKTNFRGEYINGLAVGKHKYYFPTGKIKEEGKYNSGLKDGDWKRYDEDGNILWILNFDNGIERKVDGVKIKPKYEELEDL